MHLNILVIKTVAETITRGNAMGRKNKKKKRKLSEYTLSQLPAGAIPQFIYYEDFNNDGRKEAAVGITCFSPFPPDSAVIFVKEEQDSYNHVWLHFSEQAFHSCGIIDNAAAADIDGDGVPELVVSRVLSHEQDIDIVVFDWPSNDMERVWHSGRTFFHGSMEIEDIDGDGIDEILIESGANTGEEIISLQDTFYHFREGNAYKWDGTSFKLIEHQVRMPYVSYNASVKFLRAIFHQDYDSAYDMVIMPGFLGLEGLDDSSKDAFRRYIEVNVLPKLEHNLAKGRLVPAEPFDTCCKFMGAEDCFTVELVRKKNEIMILGLVISQNFSNYNGT